MPTYRVTFSKELFGLPFPVAEISVIEALKPRSSAMPVPHKIAQSRTQLGGLSFRTALVHSQTTAWMTQPDRT